MQKLKKEIEYWKDFVIADFWDSNNKNKVLDMLFEDIEQENYFEVAHHLLQLKIIHEKEKKVLIEEK